MSKEGLLEGDDGQYRCWWQGNDALYAAYHDNEWGRPVTDDTRLFEKICLEGFQAGLSWITILRKRENFRAAFKQFDIEKIIRFTEEDVERLMKDAGIVRHRGKILSVMNNAQRAKELKREFGSLSNYFWKWEPDLSERPAKFTMADVKAIATSKTSIAISKDLKKRGWSFVGPTTVYAFMQAMGMVNDHLEGCHCRSGIEKIRKNFTAPNA